MNFPFELQYTRLVTGVRINFRVF